MDDRTFDALSKSLADAGSRRGVIQRLGALTLGGALTVRVVSTARAKQRHHHKHKKRHAASPALPPSVLLCPQPGAPNPCASAGICVPACAPDEVFDAARCTCCLPPLIDPPPPSPPPVSCPRDVCAGKDYCQDNADICNDGGLCLQPLGGGPTRCGVSAGPQTCGCASHQQCVEGERLGQGAFCVQMTGTGCSCPGSLTTFCATPRGSKA